MSYEPTQEVGQDASHNPVASYEATTAPIEPTPTGRVEQPKAGSAISATGEDLLNPSTFKQPMQDEGWRLAIEFCDRCRWLHRASWTATELFITFPSPSSPNDAPGLSAINLIPRNAPETAGRWRIWLYAPNSSEAQLVYDRKTAGGFGELKELKSLIRDRISPNKSLGHSDAHGKAAAAPVVQSDDR